MNKFLKKTLALLMGATMAFGMTACGGAITSDDGSGSSDDSSVSSEKVKIIVPDLVTGNKGLNGWTKARQDQFKADYPNIEVEYRSNPTADPDKNIQAMVQNLSNEKNAYTLLVANSNTYARTVYQSGLTADISQYLTEEDLADYNPTVLSGYYDKDKLVGLPFRQEFPLLGFNRDHLYSDAVKAKFGVTTDQQMEEIVDNIKTWDDFKEVAKKLSGTYTINGQQKTVSGYGGFLTDYYIGFGVWNIANGYNTVTQHESGKIDVDLTNEQTVETIEFLQSLKNEGALTHDPNLGYQQFFQEIYQREIASFIYYPSWATSQFEPNGIFASGIKVINIPYGPSIAELKEQAKTDPSVVVPNTNANFSLGYVLNDRATDAQKQAAVTYIKYMNGKEATLDKFEYANDYEIKMFTVPAFNFDDEYLNTTVFANVPEDWKSALTNSVKHSFIIDQNSDSFFMTYVSTAIPGMVSGKDSSGTYETREKLLARLSGLNDTVYSQFLNKYNKKYE